jgi:8-amino-7-oxononanoate synthase
MTRPGPPLIDVTSSRFLGLRHARDSLPAWADLTTGVPAVLAEPPLAGRICRHVARWQGAGAGLVARSSLHALMDVLGELPQPGDMVAIDEFAYPITEWSALRAAGRGVTVRRYAHHRPGRLVPPAGGRLFTVADGWCPGCNQPAPLGVLRQRAVRAGGLLVVDDSLAFGVVGDGAGTPAWSGVGHDGLVWVASMAKAYGAPLAVLTGGRDVVDVLAHGGGNRVHSSPPSAADLAAAASALELGGRGRRAAAARDRVTRHVLYLREALAAAGIRIGGPPFPALSLPLATAAQARRWLDRLRDRGIWAVLQQPRCRPGAALGVLLRADHAEADVERVAAVLCGLARTEAAA